MKETSLREQCQNGKSSSVHSQDDNLKTSLRAGLSDIARMQEETVLRYYSDVQQQVNRSFKSAKKISIIGFAVLIITLVYTLFFDMVTRFTLLDCLPMKDTFAVGSIGVINGLLIEFMAGWKFLTVFRWIKTI